MQKSILILFLIFMITPLLILGQAKELEAFKVLVDATWVSEGVQLGGHEGRSEQQFEFGLEGKIIKVKTYTTDPKTLVFGLRNEGIRAWNNANSKMYFYEFDKDGGITTGTVTIVKNNIYYDYQYQGTSLRDAWEFINNDTYAYTVGIWDGTAWSRKFHETRFVRQKQ